LFAEINKKEVQVPLKLTDPRKCCLQIKIFGLNTKKLSVTLYITK
jgi:hypothetical protein